MRYTNAFRVPDCMSAHAQLVRDKGGLHAFCDSTWTVPKSSCGYVVYFAGGPIAYSSRKLNLIADSTALAEYSSASACSKELTFIRLLLNELGGTVPGPIVMGVDNTAAITIAEKNGATKLTKHFDFAVHRLRDDVEHLRIKLHYVDTEAQTADIFTKALDEKAFLRHRDSFYT